MHGSQKNLRVVRKDGRNDVRGKSCKGKICHLGHPINIFSATSYTDMDQNECGVRC